MKHFPAGIAVTALFAAMLFFPKAVFKGASEGLLLWYQIIFPTLFPFLVITNLLLATGGLRIISRVFGRLSRFVFRVSSGGTFAVISGFLCGYPMGAKITADLLKDGRITPQEGKYLLSFCNNNKPDLYHQFYCVENFRQAFSSSSHTIHTDPGSHPAQFYISEILSQRAEILSGNPIRHYVCRKDF